MDIGKISLGSLPSNGPTTSTLSFVLLQKHLRRDPGSYRTEFRTHFQHLQRLLALVNLQPNAPKQSYASLSELVSFISSVSHCYPTEASIFGSSLVETLSDRASALDPELRLNFLKALIVLVNRQTINLIQVLHLFFDHLLLLDDKHLRKFILGAILSFTKELSKPKKKATRRRCSGFGTGCSSGQNRQALSNKLQSFVFIQLRSTHSICVRISEMLLIEAYKRNYWRNAKTANAISDCVFHRNLKIKISAMRFFLGSTEDEQGRKGAGEDSSSDDDSEDGDGSEQNKTLKEVVCAYRHAKKTRKRVKVLKKKKKEIGMKKKKKGSKRVSKFCNLEAIRDIFDPQKFADRIFSSLDNRKNEKYTLRLLQIALCARVIGIHQLQTLGFYSYLERFLRPKQREVTRVLLYAAQACHDLVPGDIIARLIRCICHQFITDCNSPEAITVGLNTVREIYTSAPNAATDNDEAKDLIRDLAQYKSYRNKNVSMAARSLINLMRTINPKMLHPKDRGRPPSTNNKNKNEKRSTMTEYGQDNSGVSGNEEICDDEEGEDNDVQQSEADESENGGQRKSGPTISTISNDDQISEFSYDSDEDVDSENDECCSMDGESNGPGANELDEGESIGEEEIREEDEPPKSVYSNDNFDSTNKKKSLFKKTKNGVDSEDDTTMIEDEEMKDEDENEDEDGKEERNGTAAGFDRPNPDGLPRLNAIEHFHKKIRPQTKDERMDQVRMGRQDRPEYGKRQKTGPHVGRTNRNLSKRKNFQMVKQKLRGKNRQRSFRDQQISLRKYLLRKSGRKVV